jgi:hypothetical protein
VKSIVNYSINVEVLKAFNEEVEDQTRSRLIEALIIEFLIKHSREKVKSPENNVSLAKRSII